MTMEEVDIKELDVETELACGSILIKLYKVPFKTKCDRNITAENEQGETIWQVEDVLPLDSSSFMNIRHFDKEKIIADNWIRMEYYINICTGKLELVNKNARPW
jgi:hypothetical protein